MAKQRRINKAPLRRIVADDGIRLLLECGHYKGYTPDVRVGQYRARCTKCLVESRTRR